LGKNKKSAGPPRRFFFARKDAEAQRGFLCGLAPLRELFLFFLFVRRGGQDAKGNRNQSFSACLREAGFARLFFFCVHRGGLGEKKNPLRLGAFARVISFFCRLTA